MVVCTGGQRLPVQLLHASGINSRSAFGWCHTPYQHFSTNCTGSRWHGLKLPNVKRTVICQTNSNVRSRRDNKYQGYQLMGRRFCANIGHNGNSVFLGSWDTEEKAARVHDAARIYKDKEPKNFPASEYQLDQIKRFKDFDAFVQHQRDAAGEENNTKRKPGKTSGYKGVGRSHLQWRAAINRGGVPMSFGCYYSEEDAAKAYDRACIYKNGHAKNFPDDTYDKAEILKYPSLEELAEASRAYARDLAKQQRDQRNRFSGVVSVKSNGKYEARYTFAGEGSFTRLGAYLSEEQAAKMYDSALIYEGKTAANFPEAEYDTHALKKHSKQSLLVYCRHVALRAGKIKQRSRFTGVGRGPQRKFVGSLYLPKQKKQHLGSFETEEQAAKAVDEARIKHGLLPVNYLMLNERALVNKESAAKQTSA